MKESKEETKLQSEQKTLQQCKEEVARDCGFQDWEHIVESYNPKKLVDLTDEVAELYASQFKSQLPIERTDFEGKLPKLPYHFDRNGKPKYQSQPLPIEGALSELKQEFVDYYVKRREYQNMEDSLRGMFDKFVLPHLLRKK